MTPQQRENLEKSILDSYTKDHLERMLIVKLGIKLEQEVNIDAGLKTIVNNLVTVTENGEWTDKFLFAAYDEQPVKRIEQIIKELNLKRPLPIGEKYKVAVFSVFEPEQQMELEKIINERTTFIKFNDHLEKLKKIGSQICRIEYPEGKPQGTGWLVAPDLILTNFHVVEAVINSTYDSSDVACRFDFIENSSSLEQRVYKLNNQWLIDESEYASSESKKSDSDPTTDELDYALLRLSSEAGNEILLNGSKRGWISVPEKPVAIMPNDIMLIPQHPLGRSLELAFGNIFTDKPYNDNGTRLRYNANTDLGSSGSPCFDINLMPFGLHHAGRIKEKISYNQCVPLREIIKRMIRNNIENFWVSI